MKTIRSYTESGGRKEVPVVEASMALLGECYAFIFV